MRIEEIQAAMENLSGSDFVKIRKWLAEKDCAIWNFEVEKGKL